jgi:hypothetical protein
VLYGGGGRSARARLTLLAGQRHGCLHRAPELFADTVLDFLGH